MQPSHANYEQSGISLDQYPPEILQTYSKNALYILAERAIIEGDYSGLANVLKAIGIDLSMPLSYAIERLDKNAVETIISVAKNSENPNLKSGQYISDHLINDLFDNQNMYQHAVLNVRDIRSNRIEVLKLLLESKDAAHISQEALQRLADSVPEEEFEAFCKSKGIDIASEKFKGLKLYHYESQSMKPMLPLKEDGQPTIIELLLSRTFSDELGQQGVRDIYTKLYGLDPISREMLAYTAALVREGEPISIIFKSGQGSYYLPSGNIIQIDTALEGIEEINLGAILIHEIGHFVYDHLFQNESMPFDMNPLVKIFTPLFEMERSNTFVKENLEYLAIHYFFDEKIDHQALKDLFPASFQYETAAKDPIAKAIELLGLDPETCKKFSFSSETYAKCFKENSLIDMFFLNAASIFSTERENNSEIVLDYIFDNIFKIYLANNQIGLVVPTREEIVRWAVEELLPIVVAELDLSSQEIYFLGRIGDYINRGEHSLQNGFGVDYNERAKELIVRAMEFKASNLGNELTDSFRNLEAFHTQTVSPSLCDVVKESGVYSMQFDESPNNGPFLCAYEQAGYGA